MKIADVMNFAAPIMQQNAAAAMAAQQQAPVQNAAIPTTPVGTGASEWANAIASIESRGSGDYAAMGPDTGKGRAYGRYQVMGFNIGPWTKKYLGVEMTPEQFLADPAAQDAVFNGEFGSYVQKYGNPADAASIWFTGRPLDKGAKASDVNGMTGENYVAKFLRNLNG